MYAPTVLIDIGEGSCEDAEKATKEDVEVDARFFGRKWLFQSQDEIYREKNLQAQTNTDREDCQDTPRAREIM